MKPFGLGNKDALRCKNMWTLGLALWMFGSALEMVWGQKRFYTYYLVSLVGANVLQVIVGTLLLMQGQPPVPVLGASGAVFALLCRRVDARAAARGEL